MKYDSQKHHRRSIRIEGYDYSRAGAYFITLLTHERLCLFGKIRNVEMILNEYGEIAQKCWLEIPEHYPQVILDAFVFMSDHLHGIIIINDFSAEGEKKINSSGESRFKILNTDFNSFDNCNNKIKFNKIYFNIYFRDLLVALSADLKLELPSGFVNIRIFIKSGNAIITSISFETKRNGIKAYIYNNLFEVEKR